MFGSMVAVLTFYFFRIKINSELEKKNIFKVSTYVDTNFTYCKYVSWNYQMIVYLLFFIFSSKIEIINFFFHCKPKLEWFSEKATINWQTIGLQCLHVAVFCWCIYITTLLFIGFRSAGANFRNIKSVHTQIKLRSLKTGKINYYIQ